jgi:hypothetical protein
MRSLTVFLDTQNTQTKWAWRWQRTGRGCSRQRACALALSPYGVNAASLAFGRVFGLKRREGQVLEQT